MAGGGEPATALAHGGQGQLGIQDCQVGGGEEGPLLGE